MVELNIKEAKKYIRHYLDSKKVVMLHGAPGIGKSEQIASIAKEKAQELGLEFSMSKIGDNIFTLLDIRGSQMEPTDIRGYPFPVGDKVKNLLPELLPENGQGILLFDEINQSDESVQKAFMQLILDRKVGTYSLPDSWSIIAAGNRLEDKANINNMSMPLNNRFGHITINPNLSVWVDWATLKDVDARIISFLMVKESIGEGLLYVLSKSSKEPAFPTPRSWKMASDLINGVTESDMMKNLVASQVGDAVAMEFTHFIEIEKKIDVDAIMKKPKLYHDLKELNHKFTLANGLQARYKKDAKKNIDAIMSVCFEMEDDIAIYLIKTLKNHDESKFKKIMLESKLVEIFMKKYEKYFQHS